MTPNQQADHPSQTTNPAAQPPRLLDQVRASARAAGFAEPTVAAFAAWVCRYIHFHDKQPPRDLGRAAVGQFLEHVARTELRPLPAFTATAAELLPA